MSPREEFQVILHRLKGMMFTADIKTAERLAQTLAWQLSGTGPDDPKRKLSPYEVIGLVGLLVQRKTELEFS